MNIPVCRLCASTHKDISLHTSVFNPKRLDYYLYIDLDPEMCSCYVLLSMVEISLEDGEDISSSVYRDNMRPWLRVPVDVLNKDIGQHTYKLHFVNIHTSLELDLYIQYMIQDDNPDKPYIYMNRG